MLSYGCGVYIFTSDDPFASIGMEQEELYGEYVARQVQSNVDETAIIGMVNGATHCYLSRECLHVMLFGVLDHYIQKQEYRDMVLNYCQKFIKSQKDFIATLKRYDDRLHEAKELLTNMNQLAFIFHTDTFEKALQDRKSVV